MGKRASDSEGPVERSPSPAPQPEQDPDPEADDAMEGHDGWGEVRPRKSHVPDDT